MLLLLYCESSQERGILLGAILSRQGKGRIRIRCLHAAIGVIHFHLLISKEYPLVLFKENPFYLLSVHSTDGAAAIDAALSHQRKLLPLEAEGASSEAAHWLLRMEHRSEAEYFWPSGLPRRDAFLLAEGGESDCALSPRLRLLRF